ncbi:MAG: hypothetical protein ABJC66_12080 [Gammaproteobacteria bacterium]
MRFDSARLLAECSDLQFQDVVPISIRAVSIKFVVLGFKALGLISE